MQSPRANAQEISRQEYTLSILDRVHACASFLRFFFCSPEARLAFLIEANAMSREQERA